MWDKCRDEVLETISHQVRTREVVSRSVKPYLLAQLIGVFSGNMQAAELREIRTHRVTAVEGDAPNRGQFGGVIRHLLGDDDESYEWLQRIKESPPLFYCINEFHNGGERLFNEFVREMIGSDFTAKPNYRLPPEPPPKKPRAFERPKEIRVQMKKFHRRRLSLSKDKK